MVNALFEPAIDVRCHFIISHPDVIMLSGIDRINFCRNSIVPVIDHVKQIWSPTNVRMNFDPEKGVEYRPEIEQFDSEAMQSIANKYHGKVVIIYQSSGTTWGSRAAYFHLTMLDGDNFAHEIGHYFYLEHTFVEGLKLSALADIIKQGVEGDGEGQVALARVADLIAHGVPPEATLPYETEWSKDAINRIGTRVLSRATDGDYDYVSDTPPALHEYDPQTDTPPNFAYCQAVFPINVTFSNGYTHTFQFTPDQHNVMGYGHFGGCKPRYFSNDQIKIVRNGILEGGRPHLMEANLLWTGWSPLPSMGSGHSAPAAASLGNRIYLTQVDVNHRIFIISAEDGYSFEQWDEVGGNGTTDADPALAALGDRLYIFAKGIDDGRIWVNSARQGEAFGQWSPLPSLPNGLTTSVAPAAAALGQRVYVVSRGDDSRIYVSSALEGSSFGPWAEVSGGGTTDVALAAAQLGDRLCLVGKGTDNARLYINSAVDGAPFGGWDVVPGDMAAYTKPAATGFQGRLFLFQQGWDKHVYYISAVSGQPFGKWLEVPIGGETNLAVAAASLGKRVYVFARGIGDGNVWVNSASQI